MMVIEYWQISGNGHHTEGKSWSMARPIVRRLEGREMKIIALDLGTKTGWAISTPELGVISGVQVFDVKRGESPGMRYLRFSVWMFELITQVEPNLMAYEAPHHRGGAATEILNGFSTRIQEYCADYGIEYQKRTHRNIEKIRYWVRTGIKRGDDRRCSKEIPGSTDRGR